MTQRVPYERKEDSHGLAIARGSRWKGERKRAVVHAKTWRISRKNKEEREQREQKYVQTIRMKL